MSDNLQLTLDEIKILYADAVLEAHALRRDRAQLLKQNAEQAKTIELLGAQLPSEAANPSDDVG